ncbi:unnamed protein product [Rangifer tarandus platyrhynchus]|uniref:Uncharacterized protein n=1 Tax=Rangifer tarandus platyrhynchus TaxID=3082113 RepID=A0AC59ZJR0_RANTA
MRRGTSHCALDLAVGPLSVVLKPHSKVPLSALVRTPPRDWRPPRQKWERFLSSRPKARPRRGAKAGSHPGARLSALAYPGSGPSPALEGSAALTETSAAAAPEAAPAGPRREHRAPPKECTTPGAALNTDRARRAHKNGHSDTRRHGVSGGRGPGRPGPAQRATPWYKRSH